MALKTQRKIYLSLEKIHNQTRLKKSIILKVFLSPNQNYRHYRLKKKTGGYRDISIPNPSLSRIQRAISAELTELVEMNDCVHGFIRGRSIISNASAHLGGENFLQTDIMDFFGSCDDDKFLSNFVPLIRGKNTVTILRQFCFLNGKLPQGAPSSPVISNICANALDLEVDKYCRQNSFIYTRYADDLNLSGKVITPRALGEVKSIIERHGFSQNLKKTRLINSGRKVIITGISVGRGKLHIPRELKREIRRDAHFLKINGIIAESGFEKPYDPFYFDRVMGRLNYWNQVEPDNLYPIRLMKELNELKLSV